MQPRQDPHPINVCRNRSGSDIAKHRIVMRDVDQGVDAYQAAGDAAAPLMGVTLEAIANGKNGNLAQGGLAIVEAGAAISVGAKVTAGTGGKGAASSADEDHIIGIANTEATLDGDLIEVQMTAIGTQNASA